MAGFSAQNKGTLSIDRAYTCNSDAAKIEKENPTTSTFLIAGVSIACMSCSNGHIANLCVQRWQKQDLTYKDRQQMWGQFYKINTGTVLQTFLVWGVAIYSF